MEVKVLNLEELANEIVKVECENAPPQVRDMIVGMREKIKEILRQHLKCVCKFYLKYEDAPDDLVREHPELADVEITCRTTLKEFAEHHDDSIDDVFLNLDIFNTWLFKYVFGEVITGEVGQSEVKEGEKRRNEAKDC